MDFCKRYNKTIYKNYRIIACKINNNKYDIDSLKNDLRDDIKVYFAVWGSTLDIFSSSGDSVNYTHGINYFNSNSINPKLIEFLDSYKSNYGFDASFSSMLSYETVYTLVEAIKNSDSMETEDIKASLLNLDKVNWLDDDITINDTGDSIRKLYWYHLLNNSFVEVE